MRAQKIKKIKTKIRQMEIGKTTIGGDSILTQMFGLYKEMPKKIKDGLSLNEVVEIIEKKLEEIGSDSSVKNYDNEFIIVDSLKSLIIIGGIIDGEMFIKIQNIIDESGKKSQWFCGTISDATFS